MPAHWVSLMIQQCAQWSCDFMCLDVSGTASIWPFLFSMLAPAMQKQVAIKSVELSIIDKAYEMGWMVPSPPKVRTDKRPDSTRWWVDLWRSTETLAVPQDCHRGLWALPGAEQTGSAFVVLSCAMLCHAAWLCHAEVAWLQLISSTRWGIVSPSWSEQIALEATWHMLLGIVQASCIPGLMMYGVPNMKTDKMDVVQRSGELSREFLSRRSFRAANQTKSGARSGYYEAGGNNFRDWSCWACRREHGGLSYKKQYVHLRLCCIALSAVAGAHRG